MKIKNGNPIAGMFQDARWDAWMDGLEANWVTKIAETRVEYRDERERMQERGAKLEAAGERPSGSA